MKYCQGPKCHTYQTKDRLRGPKGAKYYQTRKRSQFYNLGGNACSMICERDWFDKHGQRAIDHFGRVTEAKRVGCDGAWYKDYDWRANGHLHYIKNDLLGQRISISQQQYDNCTTDNIKDLVRP